MRDDLKTLLIFGGVALGVYWLSGSVGEQVERHRLWGMAREYCDSVGKPLLRVGMRRTPLEPPNGDVTLDIDPEVLSIPGGVLGDERAIPYADKTFGVSVNEHTIEHLHSAEDIQTAISECVRVADYAIIEAPAPYTVGGILHPDHWFRMWFDSPKQIRVKPKWHWDNWVNITWPGTNRRVGGIGGLQAQGIGQYLILRDQVPEVVGIR